MMFGDLSLLFLLPSPSMHYIHETIKSCHKEEHNDCALLLLFFLAESKSLGFFRSFVLRGLVPELSLCCWSKRDECYREKSVTIQVIYILHFTSSLTFWKYSHDCHSPYDGHSFGAAVVLDFRRKKGTVPSFKAAVEV